MVAAAEAQAKARLKAADWLHNPDLAAVLAVLDGATGRTRAVGGVVRDTVAAASRQWFEIDLATELVPDDVIARVEAAGLKSYPTGLAHGTVTVRAGTLTLEVTTLRQDIATDGRHATVQFGTDWTRDAERRDFTMNALYVGADGTLFDPLGGLADCLAGRVRFIGEPDARIAEDRLRVFRFYRFSASHGGQRLDSDGREACRRAADTLSNISAERIGAEIRRMLALPKVAEVFRAMVEDGVLDLPIQALRALSAYERRARRPDLATRLSLILVFVDGRVLQGRWRLSNDEMAASEAILNSARLLQHLKVNEAAYRYPAALSEGIEVAGVLEGWTQAAKAAILQQVERVEAPHFPISGTDLIALGLKPGRALGAELDRLETKWIDSGFALGRDALLGEVRAGN